MPPSPKMAILGAGPAGLTLASLLTKHSIPYTVFDLRSRPSSTDMTLPSGSLDLHGESGLLALESCGLLERFKELSGECGEECKLADMNGEIKHQDEGNGLRPEIARNALTHLLLESVLEERIRWERKISSIQQAEDGKKWQLSFASDPSSQASKPTAQDDEVFDLVIGADGAWSRVRPLLTSTVPYFSGMNCITLTIPHLTSKHPHLASLVGSGSYSACGAGKAVMVQRGSLDSARIYLMISSEAESYLAESGLDGMSAEELKGKLLNGRGAVFESWGAWPKELIAAGCDAEAGNEISAKPFYMLPPGHNWTHVPGLALLGDAAHLMTPFAGEGVNAAMLDALQLSEALVECYPSSPDKAIESYETKMFPRAKEIMEESFQNMKMIFAADSPRGFVEFMQSHFPPLATKEESSAELSRMIE